jgi:glycerol-3-phosphate O-acyltransferase
LANIVKNQFWVFAWLRNILFLWVRSTILPENPKENLNLKPGVPVCYVLNSGSVSDLLVLEEAVHKTGLPRPVHTIHSLRSSGTSSYVSLRKMGLLQVRREKNNQPPSPLSNLVKLASENKEMEVNLVPVSVFWGRNPGKEKGSIFKMLFFDDEHAGTLQKLFIIIAQGRSNYIRFGKPISLRDLVNEGAPPEETARKLRRVLRVHYRSQRIAALGPSLPGRSSVISNLLQSKSIIKAVQDEARKKNMTPEKAEARAVRYINEIAAEQNHSVVRVFDVFLTWLWNRIFNGIEIKNVQRIRDIDQSHEIIYLPSHRSHMDYLLLGYSLYRSGFPPPHTAAGINLNFWPIGPLLRRCGAFFIRRSFKGNRLYASVFNEYVHYLLVKGYPVKFYPEGGRSRTGKLLSAKTGMLAMVVHSFLRNSDRPYTFVPVYIGYDKVMEVRTYQSELRGTKKRNESVSQLLGARKVLKTVFGKAYISFGEPFLLADFLDTQHPDWKNDAVDSEVKPAWMHKVVSKLGNKVLTDVNSNAVLSPVATVSLILLASPTRAMAEEDLLYFIDKLTNALKAAPYSRNIHVPNETPVELLAQAMKVSKIERFAHPSGDVIFVDERESVHLTYYRNNVLHLIVVPSLIASFFQHNDRMRLDALIKGAAILYPFLKDEFFLPWDYADSEDVISNVVNALVEQKLLCREGDLIIRPDVTTLDFTSLKILSRVLGQTLERYAVSTALMARHSDGSPFERAEFEKQCQLMAQRISILNGMNEPEFFDKNLFKNYIELLKLQGIAEDAGDGKLKISSEIRALADSAINLLSSDIRQSIRRMLAPAVRK